MSTSPSKEVNRSVSLESDGAPAIDVENSFSAESPYFTSYVENELRSMTIMHETLHDIAGRTKTFSKCGTLMSDATRRLALACRLRRPVTVEDEKEMEAQERIREFQVQERRKAVGEDMTSLLGVMSEVRKTSFEVSSLGSNHVLIFFVSVDVG